MRIDGRTAQHRAAWLRSALACAGWRRAASGSNFRAGALASVVLAGAAWPALLFVEPGCATAPDVHPVLRVRGEPTPSLPPRPRLEGGEHELGLEDAVLRALEHHPDLATQRLAPAIAGTFQALERAEFRATAFADAQHRRDLSRETNRATGTQFDVSGDRTDVVLGVRQRAPTGTTLESTLGYRRDDSDRAPEQQELRLGLSVTQALLEGARPEVQLAAVRAAELDAAASVHALRAFVSALLVELEVAYWELARARRTLAIHERSMAFATQEREALRARVEVGDRAAADAPILDAELARRRAAALDAEAEVRERRFRLARLLGLDAERATLEVADAVEVEARPIEGRAAHQRIARERRPELREARLRLERAELDVVVTRHGLLPRLDVFVELAKTGFGSSFGEAAQGFGERTYEMTAGLRFEQLLGNAAAEAGTARARLEREQAERAIAALESLVALDVDLAFSELERFRAQIETSRALAEAQSRVVEAERAKVELGAGTPLLVAQAERDEVAARVAEIDAAVGWRVSLVRLYAAEGTLLERRGVTLGDSE